MGVWARGWCLEAVGGLCGDLVGCEGITWQLWVSGVRGVRTWCEGWARV